ncbi:AlkA N-terminal domain-containing protein [Nocardia sp. NPDC057353]|uniref:AlkA N-terminal domain-containing protein n=1 Tax=Nocardia sp. NPDC057353 TaxID=3346104 RepID=UPI00362EED48
MNDTALDFERCYRAVSTRDARFDGQFFTAVRTTGIYCRPSCPAITPKRANVSFLPTAAAAQQAGYRACRRCLPDAAPGSPHWNTRADLAARAMRLIGDGVLERGGVPELAAGLGYSPRQLTRVLTAELGAGPLALARAHRAHTARLLIQTTAMPISDVAFAAGFASIRQFNDTVREVFGVSPTVLRTEAQRRRGAEPEPAAGTLTLRLPFRPPLDRAWLGWFLAAHTVPGLEGWADGVYTRALRTPHGHAVVRLTLLDDHVRAELALRDMRDLAPTVARVRHLLDLDADPVGIDEALTAVRPGFTPGIRVPGCADGAELLLRTMIGQQISVAAAATHTARLVAALGERVEGAVLFPEPAVVAERGGEVLTGPGRRVAAVLGAALAVASGEVVLHAGRTVAELRRDLLALPGVGPWTADYVGMRLLGDPDILLGTDLIVRRGAELLGIDLADAGRWAPWRSYLSMHLWKVALGDRVAAFSDSKAQVP